MTRQVGASGRSALPVGIQFAGRRLTVRLDRGLLQAFFTLEQGPFDFQPTLKARVKPADPATRAFTAYALDHFQQHFTSGN